MHSRDSLPAGASLNEIQAFVCDLDNTLAFPNEPISSEMAEKLAHILRDRVVVILTARTIDVVKERVVSVLERVEPEYNRENFLIMCANGASIFGYNNDYSELAECHYGYINVSELGGNIEHEKAKKAIRVLREYYKSDNVDENSIEIIPKGSMITISFVDRNKPKSTNWDPNKIKRRKYIEKIRRLFPGCSLVPGGRTSIDISLYTKADGINHLRQYKKYSPNRIIYFGDEFATEENIPGGNDEAVRGMTEKVYTIQVENPDSTAKLIDMILRELERIHKAKNFGTNLS